MLNLKKFLLLNIYNEKSLQENLSEYTVKRALNQIKSTQRTLLCEVLDKYSSMSAASSKNKGHDSS